MNEFTVMDAARRYGQHPVAIQRLLASGRMPGVKEPTGRKRWLLDMERWDRLAVEKGWPIKQEAA